jgi:hypothetical protein
VRPIGEKLLRGRSAFGAGEVDAGPDVGREFVGRAEGDREGVETPLRILGADIGPLVARGGLEADVGEFEFLKREQAELVGLVRRQEGLRPYRFESCG